MSPPGVERPRPQPENGAPNDQQATTDVRAQYGRRPVCAPPPWSVQRGLRARREAAARMPLLACGRHRDPDDPRHVAEDRVPAPPLTFGLSEPELVAEASRLWRAGWDVSEITAVLAVPEPDQ